MLDNANVIWLEAAGGSRGRRTAPMLTALVTSSVSPQVNKAEEPRRALDTGKPCTLCTEALTQLVRTKNFFPELFLLGLSRF